MNSKFKLLLLAIPLFLFSCSSDDAATPITVDREVFVDREIEVVAQTTFDDGFFVSAEGNFQARDGSISYVTNDLDTSTNFIYRKANENTPLAGLVQSVFFGEENAYIVLNDVNTLVIADKLTMVRKDIITTGLQNPRYMTVVGDKGYVTNWGEKDNLTDDFVAVIDLLTNTLETSIPVEVGVERIIARENKLYLSHGAGVKNNKVSVIDLTNSNAISTIEVKDGADELFFNPEGQLVVLSQGFNTFGPAPDYNLLSSSEGAISFINTTTNTVERELVMPVGNTASLLAQDDQNIYYASNGEVFTMAQNATDLPTAGSINAGFIYGMEVNNGSLYTVSFEFSSFSTLSIYDLETGTKNFASSVGLGASKIYFPN